MNDEFLLQPQVYSTHNKNTLLSLLEEHWLKQINQGKGTIFILSGFGNYNGGVRFFDVFREHISKGGKILAIFGGSASQKLTSKELVKELLDCGAKVIVLNRKRIMHAKCFGYKSKTKQSLVISSGNFTGPGMSQNVEAAVGLTSNTLKQIGFEWEALYKSFLSQGWDIYYPSLPIDESPEWQLLYEEQFSPSKKIHLEEQNTLLLMLGHADTIRINAQPLTRQARGSQYFWLSKDCYDFFPPLTILNRRGIKPTYSTLVKVKYLDLGVIDKNARITFEAGNNVDFRLGTGPLRYSKKAKMGDIAAITRRAHAVYDLRIIRKDSPAYNMLKKYLIHYIGHRGKKYGYIPNDIYDQLIFKFPTTRT